MKEPTSMSELREWLLLEMNKKNNPPTNEEAEKIVSVIMSAVKDESNIPAFLKGYHQDQSKGSK